MLETVCVVVAWVVGAGAIGVLLLSFLPTDPLDPLDLDDR